MECCKGSNVWVGRAKHVGVVPLVVWGYEDEKPKWWGSQRAGSSGTRQRLGSSICWTGAYERACGYIIFPMLKDCYGTGGGLIFWGGKPVGKCGNELGEAITNPYTNMP